MLQRLLSLLFGIVCPLAVCAEPDAIPADFPISGTPVPALQSFDETVVSFMKRHAIPGGALAIVQDGKLLFARGYGYADRDKKSPALPTSLFRLASVSKPITAVAIMTLVENGKLDLDAKVVPLLGLKPFLKAGQTEDPRIHDITIRHLLQHAAGWDRDVSGDIMFKHFQIAKDMEIASPPDHASLIRWGLGLPLDFEPGKKYAYSNFGFCILGRVIEKISGVSYEEYVRRNVLEKAGIKDMRIGQGRQSERMENEVCYYDAKNETGRNVFSADGPARVPVQYGFESPQTMDAHGGWIASAVDLARFAAALDHPATSPLVNAASQAAMYARPAPPMGFNKEGTAPSEIYYGFGWNVRPMQKPGKANIWHNGAMPGTSTLLVRLANGRAWAMLFNQRADGKAGDNIDALLHKAAEKVEQWSQEDQFEKYP